MQNITSLDKLVSYFNFFIITIIIIYIYIYIFIFIFFIFFIIIIIFTDKNVVSKQGRKEMFI